MGKVTVVGGYLVGLFAKGERIPGIGETVTADEYFEGGGRKRLQPGGCGRQAGSGQMSE